MGPVLNLHNVQIRNSQQITFTTKSLYIIKFEKFEKSYGTLAHIENL